MRLTRIFSRNRSRFIALLLLISAGNILFLYRAGIFWGNSKLTIYKAILDRSDSLLRVENTNDVTSKLGNTTERASMPVSQMWQQTGQSKDLYVYSAYYKEDEMVVKVIGIVLRKANVTCVCVFDSASGGDKKIEVHGELDFLPENQNKKYTALYIKCPVIKDIKPATVGIAVQNVTTSLRVIYPSTRRYNFTVCVSCIHWPYRNYFQMIETLEADMIFGAEFFMVYNHSITPEIDRVLNHYVKLGKMVVLQWNLPQVDVHYFGQLAFLHDCILASRQKSKYLIFKDLDEMIVPQKHRNWHELMTELEKVNPKTASYIFRSSFFHLNWGHDVKSFKRAAVSETLKLNSLLNVWREKDIYLQHIRSKTIVLPEHVIKTGIHFTREVTKGYRESTVDPGIAYLHHYRNVKNKVDRVRDDTMRTYADELIMNVNKTQRRVGLNHEIGKH